MVASASSVRLVCKGMWISITRTISAIYVGMGQRQHIATPRPEQEGESMKWIIYRAVMRLAHRFNWHYAPPIYPEGDTHLWCKWCGFRQTIRRAGDKEKEISR